MPDSPDSNSGRATAHGSGAVLSVSLFGGCSLNLGEREIVVQNRKAKALIGYLAFAPNHRETRGRLAGLLWRDMDEERARGNLRHVLQTLRDGFEAAGYSGFTTDRTEVGLEAGGVRFDVLDATGSIDRDWPDDVLLDRSRIADCVLDGFEGVDPGYDSWLLVQRESLRRRWLRHLQDRFNGVPDATPNARRLAQALLQLDTTHEPACRCVMRHSADRGDGAAAITVYDRLSVRLDEFHGMPPSDETQALVEEIKRGTYRPRTIADTAATVRALTAPRAAATASEPSAVAERLVLIVNRFVAGGGEEGLVFAFRHELITRLSRFREWSIVDGEPMDLTIAAGTPCYTLSAPMIESDGGVHLMLSLRDSRTGKVVFNESHNIALKRFFKSLQAAMQQIAAKLNVYISVERLNGLAQAPDISLDIYDRWLRGQWLIQQWQPGNRERARQIYESITQDAPNFSPAYSGLAQLANADHIVMPGVYRTIERHQRALGLARTAVSLDPFDSRAHLAVAWAHAMCADHELAASHFDQACSLNEFDSWTMTSAALGYAYGDQAEKAVATAAKAHALTPSPTPLHWCYQSTVAFAAGDFEACLNSSTRVGDAVSNMPAWRAAALAHLGRIPEARIEAQHFVGLVRPGWVGATDASGSAITRWLLHCFPIRNPDLVDTLRTGLALAGLMAPAS